MQVLFQEHPSDDQLQAFAEGWLDDDVTEQIGSHVEACDECAECVDRFQIDTDLIFQTPDTQGIGREFREGTTGQITCDDRLELLDVIGVGGMGIVYKARHPTFGRHVAVKQLHVPLPQNSEAIRARERFEREIRTLGSVQHPHLAQIYASGVTQEGRLFYAMELIDGANLASVFGTLTTQRDMGRAPSWDAAVRTACQKQVEATSDTDLHAHVVEGDYIRHVVTLIRQVATAVQTLHDAGIVHRDIKPSNIMVSTSGAHATLMDLGLAGLVDDAEPRLTRTGQVAGSLPYISPEQFCGAPPSKSGDIYNLGAVLWEQLALMRLFHGSKTPSDAELMNRILHNEPGSILKYRPDVPSDLDAVALKCLARQPDDRYSTVEAMIADLDRFIAGERVMAASRSVMQRVRNVFRRSLIRVGVVVLVCLAVARWIDTPSVFSPDSSSSAVEKEDLRSTPASIGSTAMINDVSLTGYWSAEGSGSVASDASTSGNNGAMIGDTTRGPGALGSAFSFDGNGDYISFGRSSKWNFLHDGSPFCVAGFVAPSQSNVDGGILSTIDETSTAAQRQGFCLRLDGSRRLELNIQGVSGTFPIVVVSQSTLVPNVFTAIAATFDGQTARLFVNGELEETAIAAAPFASTTALDALCMGAVGTTSGPNGRSFAPFTGLIDEVRVYNRALRQSEVAMLAGLTAPTDVTVIPVVRSVAFADNGAATGASVSNSHNGKGMTAEFPTYPAGHSAAATDAFLTASATTASLHYDFGVERNVSKIRFWNYHGGVYGLPGNGCGARSIRVYGASDEAAIDEVWHDSWEFLTSFTAARAPADGAVCPYGEEYSFTTCSCRYIRLQIDNNYGGDNVGIAEVQFLGPLSK